MRMREITAFARSHDYDGAIWTNVRFKGYNVYQPYYFDGKVRYTGYPHFILQKGRKIRLVLDRYLQILSLIIKENPEYDEEEYEEKPDQEME